MRVSIPLLVFTAAGLAQHPDEPPVRRDSIVITATPVTPGYDRRNSEVFDRTLFSRDDQVFHLLDSGINAGQHEGGGKSVEIRRFGYNLDHGGVNGGLKVLIDNIQQNQSTQGHGQGYLGALKGMSPELVGEVEVINGPFSAEYGDFSGLGVVHIRLRESLPDQFTARIQGGSFNTRRGFLAYSPARPNTDAFLAYDGSLSDGPFLKPLGYRRDNVTANSTWRLSPQRAFGLKANAARNHFNSSGQLPLDLVTAGQLDRFGSLDPGDGGRVTSGTLGAYYFAEGPAGSTLRADGFIARSLFDLYSNFTFALNDPVNGDGIQQHDSRLQQGANLQYIRPGRIAGVSSLLTAGGNFHANQVNVGLYNRINRAPFANSTLAHANVTNGAGFAQQSLSFLNGRMQAGGGLRYDVFRFDLQDRVDPTLSGAHTSGRVQPKANFSFTPSQRIPVTLFANYGRGISSLDARGVVRDLATTPEGPNLATTDFLMTGVMASTSRATLTLDLFHIRRSNELVYIPDDGSLEFLGPSRSYGFEAKASFQLTRRIAFNGGITKVLNAYYTNEEPRVYLDRAPRFTANAALTVTDWRGWSGSVRMRAINSYGLDGLDASLRAAGHTVFDAGISRRLRRGLDLSVAVDNALNRRYWETQNFFESRLPGADPIERIHATPGYPITVTVGLAFRFGGK